MHKIPVGDTISRTYGFAFSNLLSIIGIAWFPYTLLVAIAVGLIMLLAPDFPRLLMKGDFDPSMMMHVGRIFGLLWLLSLVVACMVTVGIQRKALGKHPAPVFIYFSLGAPVWRLLGASFLALLLLILIGCITAGVTVGIWFAAGAYLPAYAGLARSIAILAATLWTIYLWVRLLFFLPAVVVAEEIIGLGRSWELGGGNFWRIVVVAIAVFVPAWIAFRIISGALFGPFIVMPNFHENMDYHEIMHMVVQQFSVIGPFMIVAQIVERIVYLGLGNGMIADAYLGVTDKQAMASAAAAPQAG